MFNYAMDGRLVMAGHFGVDVSQSDGAMKDWLSKTRSNRGKLTLRVCRCTKSGPDVCNTLLRFCQRCKQALLEVLVDSGCSEDQVRPSALRNILSKQMISCSDCRRLPTGH